MNEAQPSNMGNSFLMMERALKTWTCQEDTTSTLAALAYTYRGAGLLYLYRQTLRGLRQLDESLYSPSDQHPDLCDALHSKIQIEVVAILRHVDRIPLNGIPESALLFPLFLLGGEVTDPLHMDIIRMRLRLMLDKRPFQNILRALEVLEEVWGRRQSPQEGPDIDWQDAIDQHAGGLLLT
jgi:hypothetical protein